MKNKEESEGAHKNPGVGKEHLEAMTCVDVRWTDISVKTNSCTVHVV